MSLVTISSCCGHRHLTVISSRIAEDTICYEHECLYDTTRIDQLTHHRWYGLVMFVTFCYGHVRLCLRARVFVCVCVCVCLSA